MLSYANDFIFSAVFSADSQRILTASGDDTAQLWDTQGHLLTTLSGVSVARPVFSPDGKHILTAARDGTARLWDTEGQLLITLSGHTGAVTSASFSPDGQRIVTTTSDGTIRLWDRRGRLRMTLSGYTDAVTSVSFSPDGRRVLIGQSNGTIQLWPIQSLDWLTAAQCRAGRTLTEDEIQLYQVPTPLAFDEPAFAQRQCPFASSWEH